MTEKNFKIRMVATFATMLLLAMLLQSIVVLFLAVRTSIREDVAWSMHTLQNDAGEAFSNGESQAGEMVSCIYFELEMERVTAQAPCKFVDKLRALSHQARMQNKTGHRICRGCWNTFWFRNEVALLLCLLSIRPDRQSAVLRQNVHCCRYIPGMSRM